MKTLGKLFIFLVILAVALATFELSGTRGYPGGATLIKVKGETPDKSYENGRWYTLAVGLRGRTEASTFTSWAFTKTGLNGAYQDVIPLGEKLGLLAPAYVASGTEALALSTTVAQRWSGREGELPLNMETIAGSSAGMMIALAKLDAQTSGDLSGGMTVAGSGVLETKNEPVQVGAVNGLPLKLRSAAWVGADLILVPYEYDTGKDTGLTKQYQIVSFEDVINTTETKRQEYVDEPGPLVVKVPSFNYAVDVLMSLGGECGCSFGKTLSRVNGKRKALQLAKMVATGGEKN